MSLIWPVTLMRDPDVYVTDFAEYTIGAQPLDWTSRWNAAGFTALVQSVAGSLSGKALRWTKTAANRNGLSWDRVPTKADVELVIRYRAIEAYTSGQVFIGTTGRGGGASGSENGYNLVAGGGASNSLYLSNHAKVVAGTATTLGSFSYGPTPNYAVNDWIMLRHRISGTQLSRRLWHYGAAEPGTWDEQITDASLSAAGWVGLSASSNNNPDVEVDFFAVALNGKTAPTVRR